MITIVIRALTAGSIAAALIYLTLLAAAAVVLGLRLGGRRDEPVDDRDGTSASRFTIPVSLIVPATGRREGAAPRGPAGRSPLATTVSALLAMNYADFEVIVVAEGLSDSEWAAMKAAWDLEAREFYYRQILPTEPVLKIYRSLRDPRLIAVDKRPASTGADALNCGLNFARYRYVGGVAPGLIVDPDALLRAMSVPLRDPAGVAGVTSHVEVTGEDAPDSAGGRLRTMRGVFQRLASIRTLMDSRILWRNIRGAIGPHDAVSLWRRDALLQAGGFSSRAVDPGLDMMVRLQTAPAGPIDGRIVRTSQIVGGLAPRPPAASAQLTRRRQQAALETLRSGRGLSGAAIGWFTISEVVTPLVQFWVSAATIASALAGWLPWIDVVLVMIVLSFGRAAVSAVSLLSRGSAAGAPDGSTFARLLLVAPLELVVSGGVAACARAAGLFAFLRRGAEPEPVR